MRQHSRTPRRRPFRPTAHQRRRVATTGPHTGYDGWNEWNFEPTEPLQPSYSYWSRTREPIPALYFLLPLLGLYEFSIESGRSLGAVRTGIDLWMRDGLRTLGLVGAEPWLPPLLIVAILLVWQLVRSGPWRCGLGCYLGMWAESWIYAVALVGVSRLLDQGLELLESQALLQAGAAGLDLQSQAALAVEFLGAGIYEEAIFRLMLLPLLFGLLRLFQAPTVLASTLAVTGSALLFSMAHHVGAPDDNFQWYAFIFRWLAGVGFAWVFILRGFGIAVGTHVAYDVLVGCVGFQL